MSMNAIRQLNSGGLKLKSNFSARSVAANVAANRGSAAAMVKNSNYTFGSNLLFTPARRIGGTPRYASSSALSRALNGQNMRFVSGGGIPAYSGVNYKQNFTMGTSNAFNAGMGVGSMINLGLSALKQLSDMGIIGGKKDVTPQGAGDDLVAKANLSNTATTVTSSNANTQMVLNGLREASTPGELRSAIANANGALSGMSAKTLDLQAKADMADFQKANLEEEVKTKGNEVQTLANKLNGCEGNVRKAESEKLNAEKGLEDAYKQAGITDKAFIEADKALTCAQQQKADATTNKETKQASFNQATQDLQNAEQTLANTPKTRDDGTGKQVPNEPAYSNAQRAVEQAKIKKEQCEKDLKAAEQQLTKATDAEEQAQRKYDEAKKNVADCDAKLDAAKDNIKSAKDGLKTAQKKVDDAKQEQTDMKSDHEKAIKLRDEAVAWQKELSGAAGELQSHLQDVDKLKGAITKANERLSQMNQNEDNEYNANQNKINQNNAANAEIQGQYNFTDDKIDKGEKRALKKFNANDSQTRTLSARQNEIRRDQSDRDFITSLGQNGTGMNPETGKTFYVVNGQLTTEEAYNKANGIS